MFKITKEFHFCASHQLEGLPEEHPCSRLHGHNYIVKVELSCEDKDLNEVGFVVDYRELDVIKQWIDINIDHKHLNQYFKFNPTAENMSRYFFNLFTFSLSMINLFKYQIIFFIIFPLKFLLYLLKNILFSI